jgi:aspartyl protease family protein
MKTRRSTLHGALCALLAMLAGATDAVESLVVVGLFKDKAIVEIDGRRRVLTAGSPSPEGVLLLSADSKAAVIEIDGQRDTYELGTHIASRYQEAPSGVVVQITPDAAGMYLVNGSINGFATRFVVDTGATLVAMNRNEARRIGLDYKLNGLEGTAQTASGVATAYYLELDRVRVGEIELHDVDATVIDGDHPAEVLLGNSFLGRLDMKRDGRLLELRKK